MQELAKKNKNTVKVTTVRIPMDLYEQIEKEAKEQERDVSKQINYMLRKYMEIKKIYTAARCVSKLI